MNFIKDIVQCFHSEYTIISEEENDQQYKLEITSTKFNLPDILRFQESIKILKSRDTLGLAIIFGEAEAINFFSASSELPAFLSELENTNKYQKDEVITTLIVINKKKESNRISIYDIVAFSNTIHQKNLEEVFSTFTRVFNLAQWVIFEVYELVQPFMSATLFFNTYEGSEDPKDIIDRRSYLNKLNSSSYFVNGNDYILIPDDFKILNYSTDCKELCSFFDSYSKVLSAIYLFDLTSINQSKLTFKINGYKSITGTYQFDSKAVRHDEEYFRIYKWVYDGGNLIDKIGLARNIISLHLTENQNLAIKGNAYDSIQSSYRVYERQNIKQYIEIRNKISDQLLNFTERANKIVESFASGFQKNAFAVVSFYISAILLRVLGKGEFHNIFTIDSTVISLAFILMSIIYFAVSRWEVKQHSLRFTTSYLNMKERYTDLLDKTDIDRILNNDKEFLSDKVFMNSKIFNYSVMWISFLAILALITILLFYNDTLSNNKALINAIKGFLISAHQYIEYPHPTCL